MFLAISSISSSHCWVSCGLLVCGGVRTIEFFCMFWTLLQMLVGRKWKFGNSYGLLNDVVCV